MKLYIDLYKAVSQVPNVSVDTPSESKSSLNYKASYAKKPIGVNTGDSAKPDKKEVGKNWKNTGDAVEDEVEEERKAQAKPSNTEMKPVSKSANPATDLLKSFNSDLALSARLNRPSPPEVEYLLQKGFSVEDIEEGRAVISGKSRHEFTQWLIRRIPTSVNDICRS